MNLCSNNNNVNLEMRSKRSVCRNLFEIEVLQLPWPDAHLCIPSIASVVIT